MYERESHFLNIRQLTFSGENAEAYFSPDGKKLIFQTHEGDERCDQIYIMDIDSGELEMVSTGGGVTPLPVNIWLGGWGVICSTGYILVFLDKRQRMRKALSFHS